MSSPARAAPTRWPCSPWPPGGAGAGGRPRRPRRPARSAAEADVVAGFAEQLGTGFAGRDAWPWRRARTSRPGPGTPATRPWKGPGPARSDRRARRAHRGRPGRDRPAQHAPRRRPGRSGRHAGPAGTLVRPLLGVPRADLAAVCAPARPRSARRPDERRPRPPPGLAPPGGDPRAGGRGPRDLRARPGPPGRRGPGRLGAPRRPRRRRPGRRRGRRPARRPRHWSTRAASPLARRARAASGSARPRRRRPTSTASWPWPGASAGRSEVPAASQVSRSRRSPASFGALRGRARQMSQRIAVGAARDGRRARGRARHVGRAGGARPVAGRAVDGGRRCRPRRRPRARPPGRGRRRGSRGLDAPGWESTLGARVPCGRPRPGLPWHPTLPLVDGRGGRPSG